MNDRTDREAIERVLEEYGASVDRPDHASLVEWIRLYPEYAQELTEFNVVWSRMEHQAQTPDYQTVDDETLVLRGMSIFQNITHRKHSQQLTDDSVEGIVSLGAQGGQSLAALADRLELTPAIVRKLDLRYFIYQTIPAQLKSQLSEILGRAQPAIERYLKSPPRLANRAQYKSAQAPSVQGQDDFFEAVRTEPELSEDRRQRWLALEGLTRDDQLS